MFGVSVWRPNGPVIITIMATFTVPYTLYSARREATYQMKMLSVGVRSSTDRLSGLRSSPPPSNTGTHDTSVRSDSDTPHAHTYYSATTAHECVPATMPHNHTPGRATPLARTCRHSPSPRHTDHSDTRVATVGRGPARTRVETAQEPPTSWA